jgi:DNA repair photolyase
VLREELRRKRRRPRRVYFSPSSDAFQYPPRVQDVSIRTMRVLLDAGVEIAFLTKGFITNRFLALFESAPNMVFAQIGITTLDRRLWREFEPRTAPPDLRIRYAQKLDAIGVRTTARLDPLIPDVTDTEANLGPLFEALASSGVREAAASYLFLRPAIAKLVARQLGALIPAIDPAEWVSQQFDGGSAGGRMVRLDERRQRFAKVAALAQSVGIRVRTCRCKNPELGGCGCDIAGPRETAAPPNAQQTFSFSTAEPPPPGKPHSARPPTGRDVSD